MTLEQDQTQHLLDSVANFRSTHETDRLHLREEQKRLNSLQNDLLLEASSAREQTRMERESLVKARNHLAAQELIFENKRNREEKESKAREMLLERMKTQVAEARSDLEQARREVRPQHSKHSKHSK